MHGHGLSAQSHARTPRAQLGSCGRKSVISTYASYLTPAQAQEQQQLHRVVVCTSKLIL
jgi:hypothetical protein